MACSLAVNSVIWGARRLSNLFLTTALKADMASTNVFSNLLRKLIFSPPSSQQGVYYRGPSTDCSFAFQTLTITARDLMFSLSAQQSYCSVANSPAAILSVCMQQSHHKALLSSLPLTGVCFHIVPVPYGTHGDWKFTPNSKAGILFAHYYDLGAKALCENAAVTLLSCPSPLICFVDAQAGMATQSSSVLGNLKSCHHVESANTLCLFP